MGFVYAIHHTPTGSRYIGSTVNFARRTKDHVNRLRSERHHCEALQSLWNSCAQSEFEWYVIEETDRHEEREQFWIDFFGETLNTIKIVGEVPTCRRRPKPAKAESRIDRWRKKEADRLEREAMAEVEMYVRYFPDRCRTK